MTAYNSSNSSALAIFGGTFDPVHLGHLRVAWEAADALDMPLRIMLCREPAHRAAPIANPQQRAAMLRLALAGQDRLTLDERELKRPGPSYTIDTLEALRAEFGPQLSLTVVLGADAFSHLPSWKRWRELFDLAHLAVLTRPGYALSLPEALALEIGQRHITNVSALRATPAGHVITIPVSALEISATAVRALLAAGEVPRYLVPDALLADPITLYPYTMAGNAINP